MMKKIELRITIKAFLISLYELNLDHFHRRELLIPVSIFQNHQNLMEKLIEG